MSQLCVICNIKMITVNDDIIPSVKNNDLKLSNPIECPNCGLKTYQTNFIECLKKEFERENNIKQVN